MDMAPLDDITVVISQRFETEEACHKNLMKKFKSAPEDIEAVITKNDAGNLTLIRKGKNTTIHTCIPTYNQ